MITEENILLLFIFIFVIIICYYKTTQENFNVYKNYNSRINYMYWTGGYDSTYNVCYSLIKENKIVQPIYFLYNLDNDSTKKLWVRRNRKQEFDAMDLVTKKISEKFPHLEKNLLPTWFIKKDLPDKKFTRYFLRQNLFPTKRKVHQYEHLARFAYNTKIPIDIGVIGVHETSRFVAYLNKYLVEKEGAKVIPHEHPFKYLRFPLFGLTKERMLEKAKENNFDDILSTSWSCWFPTKEGTPCGVCPMCRERIIDHPNL